MGQFLAIELATKIGVKKSDADKASLNVEQVQEQMQHDLHFVPGNYTASQEDDFYI
jgi:hypothetical protein